MGPRADNPNVPRTDNPNVPRADNPNSAPNSAKVKEPLITVASRQALLAALYEKLATTIDPAAAKPVVEAIWKLWSFSGSATTDVLVERARQSAGEPGAASSLKFLDATVELQPHYAQGWFLRAMIYKRKGDSHRMVGDLRHALTLDPRHFEALKALAAELGQLGQSKQAREAYARLITIFPAAAKSTDPVLQLLNRDFGGLEL